MAKKKGGKKKKSKEQEEAERLAREEEERIAREEEEKRLEEERIEREARELRERLERERLRREELERLENETKESEAYVLRKSRIREQILKEQAEAKEWEMYLNCTSRPNPKSVCDLNTKISEWEDEKTSDLQKILEECEEAEYIVADLKSLLSDALCSGGNEKTIETCELFIKKTRDLEMRKMDVASEKILLNAKEYVTPKKAEVLYTRHSENLKLGIWINLASKGFRMKIIEFPDLNITTEIPKSLALQNIAVRALYTSYDNVSDSQNSSDQAIGGIIFLELIELPPESKTFKNWTIRPIDRDLVDKVKRVPYPIGGEGGELTMNGTPVPPITVKYQVSPTTILKPSDSSPVRVGWWDDINKCWSEENIQEVTYDEPTRTVKFQTNRLCAMAIIQSSLVDFPYKFWSLRPNSPESVLYSIKSPRGLYVIQIQSNSKCKLIEPLDPELEHIIGKELSATDLFGALSDSGINLCPKTADVSKVDGVLLKKDGIEEHMYTEISKICAAFTVCSSKWNQNQGKERCCVTLYESLEYEDDSAFYAHILGDSEQNDFAPDEEENLPTNSLSEQEESKDASVDSSEEKESDETQKENSEESNVESEKINETEVESKEQESSEEEKTETGDDAEALREESAILEVSETVMDVPKEQEGPDKRCLLFECDEEVHAGVKCSLIQARENCDSFNSNLEDDQHTFVYVENLIKSARFSEEAVHIVQTVPVQFAETVRSVLLLTRPLVFTT